MYRAIRPLLFALPPELAHLLTLNALRAGGVVLPAPRPDDSALRVRVAGLEFSNPLGLAAGFDKDAAALAGLAKLGFGFCEVGTLTPQAQGGNPRPRIFRDVENAALINRLGFNNGGVAAARDRLIKFREQQRGNINPPIGVNIGANKINADNVAASVADYQGAAAALAPLADYLTINISSPNTPQLRELQGLDAAKQIMTAVKSAAPNTPIFIKLAPDLETAQATALAEAATAARLAGLILTNTTIAKDGVRQKEEGGVSGQPLFAPSTKLLGEVYRASGGELTLIGVGGVASAAQAYAKIRSGASLVQLYTGLVYNGLGLAGEIKRGLHENLRRDGFSNITDAIGADIK